MSSDRKVEFLRPSYEHGAEASPASKAIPKHGDGDGHGPYDGGMEQRVAALEGFASDAKERLTRIETKLDSTVTKADLAEAMNSQIKWMVGTALGLGAAAITVIAFVLNNATPKASALPAQPPIIINVPGAPAAAPVAPSATTAPSAKTP